jgi:hypothetical protein
MWHDELFQDARPTTEIRKRRDRMAISRISQFAGALLTLAVFGAALRADEISPPLDESGKLVLDLKHQDFAVRESATRKLPSLGKSVIAPVTEIALQENLEAGLRAVSVLEKLYLSEDTAAFDQAEASLNRLLTESKHPAVAQKAAETLEDNHFTVTQRRAIAEVRRLGGQIQMQRDFPVLVNGEQLRPEGGWAQAAAINRHWKGGEEGLRHLVRLKSLQTIYLVSGHPLTEEDIRQLEIDMPDTVLQTRGRAMLGVGTRADLLGCFISQVRPDSAAAEVGMQVGDVVVEISGQAVRQPEDLIRLIGEQTEDEPVEIIVLRGDPIVRYALIEMLTQPEQFSPVLAIAMISQMKTKFTVTLGEWSIDG